MSELYVKNESSNILFFFSFFVCKNYNINTQQSNKKISKIEKNSIWYYLKFNLFETGRGRYNQRIEQLEC